MPYFSIVMISACAAFFWLAAELEHSPRWFWSGLSLLISAAMLFWLQWGFIGIILGQAGLFIGITIFRPGRKY